MEFEGFIKLDGIPGESTDDKHKEWIELVSFGHSIVQPVSQTKSSSGGASAARSQHGDFQFSKLIDKASPKIYEYCSSGKHLKEATVEFSRAGGDKVKFMEIKMEQVMISSVQQGGGGGFPSESVTLNYGKIKWTYTQQKRADGSGGGNVSGGWDLLANKASA